MNLYRVELKWQGKWYGAYSWPGWDESKWTVSQQVVKLIAYLGLHLPSVQEDFNVYIPIDDVRFYFTECALTHRHLGPALTQLMALNESNLRITQSNFKRGLLQSKSGLQTARKLSRRHNGRV